MTKLNTLFLAANPKGTTPLALDEEIREITHKIRLSEGRDVLDVNSFWAVRPDDLLQYLNQYKPQIVHFSGHGSDAGEIILVDNNGNAKPVSPQALKALFSTLKDNIQIVVLNACFSKIQGEAINEVIDYVVGMNNAIGDRAAITFASSFYRALGFDRTVQEAFDQAKTALLLEGIPEENTPELLVKENVSPHQKLSLTTNGYKSRFNDVRELLERNIDQSNNSLTQRKELAKELMENCRLWSSELISTFANAVDKWSKDKEAAKSEIVKLEQDFLKLDYWSLESSSPVLLFLKEDNRFERFAENCANFYKSALYVKRIAYGGIEATPGHYVDIENDGVKVTINSWREEVERILRDVNTEYLKLKTIEPN